MQKGRETLIFLSKKYKHRKKQSKDQTNPHKLNIDNRKNKKTFIHINDV